MARVLIQFAAVSNVGPAIAGIEAINAALAKNASVMHGSARAAAKQQKAISDAIGNFRRGVQQGGAYTVETMRVRTETSRLTEAIQKQKLHMNDLNALRGRDTKSMRGSTQVLRDLVNEQLRLRDAVAVSHGRGVGGRMTAELVVPTRDYANTARFAAAQTSILAQAQQAASKEVINLGKNFQWTGRQLAYGTTVPIMGMAAGLAVAAYQVDKEMTRLAKVFGDVGEDTSAQLEGLREETMDTAQAIARDYGIAAKESVGVAADLAASGIDNQRELQNATRQTTRLMMLGEVDRQEAMKTTITLQQAFGIQNEDLAYTFDKLNAIENETVATLQDLTEAIPRAGGVVAQLGGTVDDLNVMMVALRQNGFAAGEGANAIRSALGRIIAPADKTVADLQQIGIDIMAIRQAAEGNPMQMLTMLGDQLSRLSNLEEITALRELFGIYQYGRMTAVVKGLRDLETGFGGVAEAAQISYATREELARNSEREENIRMRSASGRMDSARAAFMAQAAEIGEPILKALATVVDFAAGVLAAINAIPGVIKQFIVMGAVILAAVGPLIYMRGIFKVLVGQFMLARARIDLMNVGTFKIQDAQTAAAAAIARTTGSLSSQADQTARLTAELEKLSAAMARATVTSTASAGRKTTPVVPGLPNSPLTGALNTRNYDYRQPLQVNPYGQSGHSNALFPQPIRTPQQSVRTEPIRNIYQDRAGYSRNIKNGQMVQEDSRKMAKVREEAHRTALKMEAARVSAAGLAPALAPATGIMGRLSAMTGALRGNMISVASGALLLVSTMTIGHTAVGKVLTTVLMLTIALNLMGVRLAFLTKAFRTMYLTAAVMPGMMLKSAAAAGGLSAAVKAIPAALGQSLFATAALLGPFLAVAAVVGAIGYSVVKGRKEIAEAKKNTEDWLETSKRTKETLEATGDGIDINKLKAAEQATSDAMTAAEKWREENQRSAEIIGSSADAARTEVVRIGIDVYGATGNAKKAHEAMRLALQGGNREGMEIPVNFTLGNFQEIADENVRRQLEDIGNDSISIAEKSSNAWSNLFRLDDDWAEIKNLFGNAGGELADAMNDAVATMSQDTRGKFEELGHSLYEATMSGSENALRTEGLATWNGLVAQVQKTVGELDVELSQTDIDLAKSLGIDATTERGLSEFILRSGELGDKQGQLSSGFKDAQAANAQWIVGQQAAIDALYEQGIITEDDKNSLGSLFALWNMFTGKQTAYAKGVDKTNNGLSNQEKYLRAVAGEFNYLSESADQARESTENFTSKFQSNINNQAQRQVQEIMRQFDAQTEAEENALDERLDNEQASLDARADAVEKAFEDREERETEYWEGQEEALQEAQDAEIEAIKDGADARIQAIQDIMDAEEEQEEARERMFEAARRRLQRMASMANQSIDFNLALNSGELDEAARIQNQMAAQTGEWAIEDSADDASTAAEKVRKGREEDIEYIERERDARIEALDDVHKAQEDALAAQRELAEDRLEMEREAAKDSLEVEKKNLADKYEDLKESLRLRREETRMYLEDELAMVTASVPATGEQWENLHKELRNKYTETTGHALDETTRWSKTYNEGFHTAFAQTQAEVKNDTVWREIGANISAQTTEGLLGMTFEQFATWMRTGKMPGPKTGGNAPGTSPTKIAGEGGGMGGRHSGGTVNSAKGDRAGRPMNAPLYPDEVPTILQRGEYVVQRKAVDKVGTGFLNMVNSGQVPYIHHSGGLAGTIGAAVGANLMNTVRSQMALAVKVGAERKVKELFAAGDTANIPAAFMGGGTAVGGEEIVDAILKGLRQHESNNNYRAESPISSASGAYQYINSTWANFGGYRRAKDAPPDVQDARARRDMLAAYQRYGNWEAAVASHFYPAWATRRDMWNRSPSAGNPTVQEYVSSVMSKAGMAGAFGGWAWETGAPDGFSTTLPGSYAFTTPYEMGGGRVTGDVQGLRLEFLKRLAAWSAAQNTAFNVGSGYRSMEEQAVLYQRWLNGVPGQAPAAPPGSSNHNYGLAADGPRWGGRNPGQFGLTYPMSYEPWHVEPTNARLMRHLGGLIDMPQLDVGGIALKDGVAKIHRDEAVLTAPLSKQLMDGLSKLDNGGGVTYNITVNAGSNASADDIANAAIRKIEAREMRIGKSRTIGRNK